MKANKKLFGNSFGQFRPDLSEKNSFCRDYCLLRQCVCNATSWRDRLDAGHLDAEDILAPTINRDNLTSGTTWRQRS